MSFYLHFYVFIDNHWRSESTRLQETENFLSFHIGINNLDYYIHSRVIFFTTYRNLDVINVLVVSYVIPTYMRGRDYF